jgi:hypothetical protein
MREAVLVVTYKQKLTVIYLFVLRCVMTKSDLTLLAQYSVQSIFYKVQFRLGVWLRVQYLPSLRPRV